MDEKGAACWKAGGSRAILGEEEKPAKEARGGRGPPPAPQGPVTRAPAGRAGAGRSPAAPPQMGALQEVEEEKKR